MTGEELRLRFSSQVLDVERLIMDIDRTLTFQKLSEEHRQYLTDSAKALENAMNHLGSLKHTSVAAVAEREAGTYYKEPSA